MGYEMYRLLTSKKVLVKPGRKSKKAKQAAAAALASNAPVVIDLEEEDRNKELLKGQLALVFQCRILMCAIFLRAA